MKAYREDYKSIYLLKTTHQRRDLEVQRLKIRLRLNIWPKNFGSTFLIVNDTPAKFTKIIWLVLH